MNAVVATLANKLQTTGVLDAEIGYLRDKKNRDKEIDVVFEYNNTFNYVEVKCQDNATPKEADTLMSLSRAKPEGDYIFLSKNSTKGGTGVNDYQRKTHQLRYRLKEGV